MASLKAMAQEAKSRKNSSVPKKESRKAPEPIYKSAEFIEETDDEDEKRSYEESDDEEEELPALSVDAKTKANGKFVAPDGSSSESESESDGTEDSSSYEEGEEAAEPEETPALSLEPTKKPTKELATRAISFKTAPYQPPTGFERGKLGGASKAAELFKKSNLEGKQIWYFTAPASVPISAIESMSFADVKNGESVLEHSNSNYDFMQDSTEDKTYTKIMVPKSSDDGYRTAFRSIDQILHLQQIVNLPGVHEGIAPNKDSASKSTVPMKRPARPQPRGLKMRFRPLGFGSGEIGNIGSSSESGSDVDMDAAPAVVRPDSEAKSKSKSEKYTPSKKRKHVEGEMKKSKNSSSSTTEAPSDKKLKRLKKKQTEIETNITDKLLASSSSLESSTHNRQRESPVPLSKSSQASDMNGGSNPSQSSQKSGSKKRDRSSPSATDAGLMAGEEKRKAKKLKKAKREGHSSS